MLVKKIFKSLFITFLLWLKKIPAFKDISFITGDVEIHHYHAATGKTDIEKLPMQLVNFNTVNNNLKYAVAKLISSSGNTNYIGTNTLMTQSSYAGKDGIVLNITASELPMTTTKDSGGNGAQNWVKFKGVRTAAGVEVVTTADLGLNFDDTFGTAYASQTVSKTLALNDVFTLYWTLTAN